MKLRVGAAVALLSVILLAGCGPVSEGTGGPSKGDKTPASDSAPPSPIPTASASESPTPSSTTTPVAIPSDCRALVSKDVLEQLKDVPLNDPDFGEGGLRDDGSLLCNWGDPQADTTGLTTTVSRMNRGPALDMLNSLADDEGFRCYTPDQGTRCEKTWANEQYPVTDGRTLFWRDGVLIDTRYSNLAPKGYTSSIIRTLWG